MEIALLGFRIHHVDLKEIQFAVKIRFYNPTKAANTLSIDQVVANYNGSAIAYSQPDINAFTIEAGGTKEH